MPGGSHALLSASAAHRWLNCPPSAKICAELPDTESEYAKEGSLAHEMCEIKLNAFITPTPKGTLTRKLNKLKKDELYKPEMDGYTDDYVDYIKKIALSFQTKAHISSERKVDYSEYAPGGFGTADCIILHGNDLYIIDFKYGKGVPVSAEDNPQMKLYALGALREFSIVYPISNVHLSIVQPRIGNISEWEISAEDLLSWGEQIKPIARLAYDGNGDFKSGDHCRFCKIKQTCRERAKDNLKLTEYEFAKPVDIAKEGESTLSDDEVGEVLKLAGNLKKWVEDIEAYALTAILNGKEITGWKAVEGRTTRSFTDIDKVFEVLEKNSFPREAFYERKQLPFTKIESIVGKKDFEALLEHLITRTKGKPTLVPESDKRPPYVQGTSADEDFKK